MMRSLFHPTARRDLPLILTSRMQTTLKSSGARAIQRRFVWSVLIGLCVSGTTACHGLLDATDPTAITDADIANAAGANARRNNVVYSFSDRVLDAAVDVALFTDERAYHVPATFLTQPLQNLQLQTDQRNSLGIEQVYASSDPHLGHLDEIITRSSVAIPPIRSYVPDSLRGDFLAQMYAMRGYAIVQMAEDICSGFPINDVDANNLPVYSAPYTTDSALAYGITQLDSAIANAHDSVQFLNFANVLKGRALLDLGQYAQAAAAVANVPTDFAFSTDPSFNNAFYVPSYQCCTYIVGEREGQNGLPFGSAQDPRVPTMFVQSHVGSLIDSIYDQRKYPAASTTMIVASGAEARLIEAEAALQGGDVNGWANDLNALRQNAPSTYLQLANPIPALTTDSTTLAPSASFQVDVMYRERAFWLYLTGRRLGDLRRLIRNYGRDPEAIFPTGTYALGGVYGTATSMPFSRAAEGLLNPKVTAGCISR